MNSVQPNAANVAKREASRSADDDGAFSVSEFLARYSIGRTDFYKQVGLGRITVKKHGKRTLVPRASARAWFASLPEHQALAT